MTGVGRVGNGGNVHCQEFATRILPFLYKGSNLFLTAGVWEPLTVRLQAACEWSSQKRSRTQQLRVSLCSLGLWSPHRPSVPSLFLPFALSLSLFLSLSPRHFCPLLLCSPDPFPEDVHFAFCEFSTSPTSQCPLPLQRHSVIPRSTSSLTPPHLRRSWLACSLRAHPPEVLQSSLSL